MKGYYRAPEETAAAIDPKDGLTRAISLAWKMEIFSSLDAPRS